MKLVVSTPLSEQIIDLDSLSDQLIFLVYDSMSMSRYLDLRQTHGVPDMVISDHPDYADLPDHTQWIYCPGWLYHFVHLNKNLLKNHACDSQYCCNFMINKKQINRYLLLKLVEWFRLESVSYTWSGIGASHDCERLLQDFDLLKTVPTLDLDKFRSCILSPVIGIETRFDRPYPSRSLTDSDKLTHISNYGGNVWAWNHVAGKIFAESVVALISESVAYERATFFTEKTVYAVLGLTFPIWIGGYRQADLWKQQGFDVFDDVIDHDYQYRDSLLERCFYAIHANLEILSNLDLAKDLRNQHMARLLQNRDMLVPNIGKIYSQSMAALDPVVQTIVRGCITV